MISFTIPKHIPSYTNYNPTLQISIYFLVKSLIRCLEKMISASVLLSVHCHFRISNILFVVFLLTCVRINIYKVISREDNILLWFTFYVNWHLSNNRYHILPYHIDTYGGFVEFPKNGVYSNWSVFWSIMVNPRFFIKHLGWCYFHRCRWTSWSLWLTNLEFYKNTMQ